MSPGAAPCPFSPVLLCPTLLSTSGLLFVMNRGGLGLNSVWAEKALESLCLRHKV